MSYIVRHGLSEVLLSELVDDIKASVGFFTLLLDETTTSQVKKQCDFLIRYWSKSEDNVSTRYIASTFFAHTSANDLQEIVNNVLESSNISAQEMASLPTDGLNINKALHRRLDEKMKEEGHPGLLLFDPCVLHKTHGGFHKGILQYDQDVEHLSFELHSWFKIAPCKREDFVVSMQVPVEVQNRIFTDFKKSEILFYRHVESRWLTLILPLKKVEERWDQSKQYFMEFLTSKKDFEKTTQQNPRYQRIAAFLEKKSSLLFNMHWLLMFLFHLLIS